MLVKYIIPEDGDEIGHPNVFNLSSDVATLSEIRKGFPVPGAFHFRFMKAIGNLSVWMDAVDNSEIPPSNGSVFLKASRSTSGFPPVNISSVPVHEPIIEPVSPVNNVVKPPKPVKAPTENLIFDFNDAPAAQKTAPAATFEPLLAEDDLLGMSSSNSAPKQQSNSDLFGLESIQPTKPSAMNNSRGVSPMGGVSMMQQQPPPQQQQQPMSTSNRHGSIGAGVGMGGMNNMGNSGMGSQQKLGGFDPFDNLTGLGPPRPLGQQGYNPQQNNLNNNNTRSNMNQNPTNRGRGY